MYIDIHTHTHWTDKDITSVFNIRYGFDKITDERWFSVGIHPWDADKVCIDDSFYSLAKSAIAIGECGLDKKCSVSLDCQESVFTAQIELSKRLNKPLIIHCVGCYGKILEMSIRHSPHPTWIIHGCYTSPEWIRSALSQPMFFSVGMREISYPKGKDMLNAIPRDRLLFESDDDVSSVKAVYDSLSINPEMMTHCYELIDMKTQ